MGYPCQRACSSRVPHMKRRDPHTLPTKTLRDGTGLDAAPADEASRELQVPVGPTGRTWIPHPAEPSAVRDQPYLNPWLRLTTAEARQALPLCSAMLKECLRGREWPVSRRLHRTINMKRWS
jgi:hypothetical protein